MGCGPSAPAENYSPPSTGATENGPQLCLTRKGSPDALVFDQAHNLSGPAGARLTLRSHPGWAVVPRYDYPRSAEEWRYIELGLGPAHMAAHMQLQGEFLVRLHDERVMDIAHWKYEEGNRLTLLRSAHNHPGNTRKENGGRSFVVNADGTISPMKAKHLVLGASEAMVTAPVQPIAQAGPKFDIYTGKPIAQAVSAPVPHVTVPIQPVQQEEGCECFPADATVELKGGGLVRLDELKVGDIVRSSDAPGGFSTVYTFAHLPGDTAAEMPCVKLALASGDVLELTAKHLVPVTRDDGKIEVIMARLVRLDDELTVVGKGRQRVVAIGTTAKTGGAFAPFTRAGTIAINGVVASCYSGDFWAVEPLLSPQALAKLMLMPLVAAHALLPASAATAALEQYGVGSPGFHPYVAGLMRVAGAFKWIPALWVS